jgi:hypothetical protein
MADEGDGQDSRLVVKPVPFEQARAKMLTHFGSLKKVSDPSKRI